MLNENEEELVSNLSAADELVRLTELLDLSGLVRSLQIHLSEERDGEVGVFVEYDSYVRDGPGLVIVRTDAESVCIKELLFDCTGGLLRLPGDQVSKVFDLSCDYPVFIAMEVDSFMTIGKSWAESKEVTIKQLQDFLTLLAPYVEGGVRRIAYQRYSFFD